MPTSSYPERRKRDFLNPQSHAADRFESPQKRVRGADLIVPVGPNQQQMLHLRVCGQVLDEIERRCVQPLQIIKEQRERMFLAREHAEETSENHLGAVLRILWRQIGDRRLFPDYQFQFGDEIDDQADFAPKASRSAPRHSSSSTSLLPRIWRTRVWNACARVA